jgi:hypothetical protein
MVSVTMPSRSRRSPLTGPRLDARSRSMTSDDGNSSPNAREKRSGKNGCRTRRSESRPARHNDHPWRGSNSRTNHRAEYGRTARAPPLLRHSNGLEGRTQDRATKPARGCASARRYETRPKQARLISVMFLTIYVIHSKPERAAYCGVGNCATNRPRAQRKTGWARNSG